MRKFTAVLIVMVTILAAAGCSGAGSAADIRGTVTSLTSGEGRAVLLVEGSIEKDTSYDKASVTVTLDTSVYINVDGSFKRAVMGDIKQGGKVEVVFDGAVAESYPVQGRAKTVRIIS